MKTEAKLVDVVKHSFVKNRFIVYTEVPMLSKKIDVVCINPNTNDVYAIEAKMHKWRRALQQALTYRLCSDFSYIAIPEENSDKVDTDLLSKYGIGLIVVHKNGITVPQEASVSNVLHHRMKEDIINRSGGV
ncbi:MAG: hypothetical protein WC974_00080 [Thermoplasmata archaeon]